MALDLYSQGLQDSYYNAGWKYSKGVASGRKSRGGLYRKYGNKANGKLTQLNEQQIIDLGRRMLGSKVSGGNRASIQNQLNSYQNALDKQQKNLDWYDSRPYKSWSGKKYQTAKSGVHDRMNEIRTEMQRLQNFQSGLDAVQSGGRIERIGYAGKEGYVFDQYKGWVIPTDEISSDGVVQASVQRYSQPESMPVKSMLDKYTEPENNILDTDTSAQLATGIDDEGSTPSVKRGMAKYL